MDVAGQIRQIYEARPYPRLKQGKRRPRKWQMAPMEWITAVWQPTEPKPGRILVAGCGTGAEAFALRRKFPQAEITAVDFSPRSIGVARAQQRRERPARKIQFIVGDLAARSLAQALGRPFDFVTCHGVLSYIPNPARTLKILAGCLAPTGALYLGVNGATHFSVAWRRVLRSLGYDVNRFEDGPRLRRHLKVLDALAGMTSRQIARQESEFLAGDLFGALNQALPLSHWNRLARRADLVCCGSFAALAALRSALNGNLCEMLMPRSRGEVAEILDWLCPSGFHWLVYKRSAPPAPPWLDADAMLDWRPQLTQLYLHRWPARRAKSGQLRKVEFRSQSTNAVVEMQVPDWELEILQRSGGRRTLRQILAPLPNAPPTKTLQSQLFLLHQFAVLNLLPPARPVRVRG
jgi:SAM-dependent methyltransferase